jgi:hypothetical protein
MRRFDNKVFPIYERLETSEIGYLTRLFNYICVVCSPEMLMDLNTQTATKRTSFPIYEYSC